MNDLGLLFKPLATIDEYACLCVSPRSLAKGKLAHLEQALLPTPLLVEPAAVVEAYFALFNAQQEVACLMLIFIWVCLVVDGNGKDLQGLLWLDHHKTWETIAQMHAILKLSKKGIPKKVVAHVVLAIRGESSGSNVDLEVIQDIDTQPSENTSEHHDEEHEKGDLIEPANYKFAFSNPISDKWVEAMNAEMQSMKDNQSGVWLIFLLMVGLLEVNDSLRRSLIWIAMIVYKLQQSIYALKQALRSWNTRFNEDIKKLGEATYILGIKIYRDRTKRLIGLSQNAYLDKISKRFKTDNSKRGNIPMQERPNLSKTQGASTPKGVRRVQRVPYVSAIRSIMYAVRCTRPNVSFTQNITSRFQQIRESVTRLLLSVGSN
ncbi:hypothetical protein Tco_0531910 [Tanacetum coccineum]